MTIEKTFNFQALSDSIKIGLINHLQMKIKKALGDKDLGNAAKLLLKCTYIHFYFKGNETRFLRYEFADGAVYEGHLALGQVYIILFLGKHCS